MWVLRNEKEIVLHSARKTPGSNGTMLLKPCVGVSYVGINRRVETLLEVTSLNADGDYVLKPLGRPSLRTV